MFIDETLIVYKIILGKKICESSREFIRNMYSISELANDTYGVYEIYIIILSVNFL